MRKITCHCDQVFNVDFPETVNLDNQPEITKKILDGSFLSCICPSCNATLRTELQTRIDWPSRNQSLTLIPELDRLSYMGQTIQAEKNTSVVIGYPELADRVAVLLAKLDPVSIETIKYHLALKAKETTPSNIQIFFEKLTDRNELEFHIHGLRPNEVAVTYLPFQLYQSLYTDIKKNPDTDPQSLISSGQYISVNTILIEDKAND